MAQPSLPWEAADSVDAQKYRTFGCLKLLYLGLDDGCGW